ncbi:MAG: hypothetical protein IKW80_10770, partial [Thermoguttaceae bacterium]|nr:hypothetical protein [Thermoguttaceae bacterium]
MPLHLSLPIETVRPMERSTLEQLHKLGLTKVQDVLFNFPRDYEDFTNQTTIDKLVEDSMQTVVGTLSMMTLKTIRGGKTLVSGYVQDASGRFLELVWFNQPYRLKQYQDGSRVCASGKPK